MKTIKYHWLWAEYKYLHKSLDAKMKYLEMLGGELIKIKEEVRLLRTKLSLMEDSVRAALKEENDD